MPILIKHLHAAIVEADITMEEWLAVRPPQSRAR